MGSLCSPPGGLELAWSLEPASPRSLPSRCLQTSLHWHKGKLKAADEFLPGWEWEECVQICLAWTAVCCSCRRWEVTYLSRGDNKRIKIIITSSHRSSPLMSDCHISSLLASWQLSGSAQVGIERLFPAWGLAQAKHRAGWNLQPCLSEQHGHH